MKIKTKDDRRERIHLRQRKRIAGTVERPRLNVFRSASHIYAQIIDDLSGKTLAAASSTDPKLKDLFAKDVKGGNLKGAEVLGKVAGEKGDVAAPSTERRQLDSGDGEAMEKILAKRAVGDQFWKITRA